MDLRALACLVDGAAMLSGVPVNAWSAVQGVDEQVDLMDSGNAVAAGSPAEGSTPRSEPVTVGSLAR
jgi:hypothetical protein